MTGGRTPDPEAPKRTDSPDPDRAALDDAALDAFSLAVRVMIVAFDIEAPGTAYEKPWELLKEIAEGETTLLNPAEMAAKFPQLKDFLYDRVNRRVEHDRETALRILRGVDQAY